MSFRAMEQELYALKGPYRKGESHPEFFKRFKKLTRDMLPRENIVVVGTNGKGTTSQLLFHLLRAQGFRVGLFTSPHLVHLAERFRYEDKFPSEDELLDLRARAAQRLNGLEVSFFETLTVMALEWFSDKRSESGLDFVVWEAGLGGRYDPAAQVPHEITVLATISLDHQELLGESLAEIAWQKLGAVSKHGVLVSHSPHPAWEHVFKLALRMQDASWARADGLCQILSNAALTPSVFGGLVNVEMNLKAVPSANPTDMTPGGANPIANTSQRIKTPWGDVSLNLLGSMAAYNLELALCACQQVAGSIKNLARIEGIHFWGRSHWITKFEHPVLLSGDHNREGWEHLAAFLKSSNFSGKILYRLSKEEKRESFVETMSPCAGFELIQSQGARAEEIEQEFREALASLSAGQVLVISGSLYFLGDWMSAVGINPLGGVPGT